MNTAAILTGLATVLGSLLKLLSLFYKLRKFNKKVTINLNNHKIFTYVREWKHNIIKISHPSRRKEDAIKRLICTMIDVINQRSSELVGKIKSDKKFKCDMIKWHMDTVDSMYHNSIDFGTPERFVEKFRLWSEDEDKALLRAVKIQVESEHLSFAHLVDDILKDYIMIFGMIFTNVERVKDDFLTKLNGELDKILDN